MNQQLLRTMAVDAGMPISEIHGSEVQTVRAIQQRLGMDPCFRTDKRLTCDRSCRFRPDCCGLVAEWMR